MTNPPNRPGTPVLANHPTQSATAIDGWKSVLFGLPFLVAGAAIAFMARQAPHGRQEVPPWLIGLFGGLFFFSGVFFVAHGLRGIVRRAAYLRDARQRPDQPWMYDVHWRQDGIGFSAFHSMLQRLMAALVWNAILVPFFWVGVNVKGGGVFLAFAVVFGLVGLVFWFRWAQMLAEMVRYGNSALQYDSFPYSLGGTMRARLRPHRRLAVIRELTVTFRCVEEKYVTSGLGQRRSTQVVCYELYKDVARFGADQLAAMPDGIVPLEFRIPTDQPPTALASTPPLYWEIEARGTAAHGADYEAYFLVPVYKTA